MLTLSECRKILGQKFESCTDQQIIQIRDWLYSIAKLELSGSIKYKRNEKKSDPLH